MRPFLSAVLILALAACGAARDASEYHATVHELPSPAGEGNGEPFLSSIEDGVYLSWLQEATDGAHEIRLRADSVVRSTFTVSSSSAVRASGFPRIAIPRWRPDAPVVARIDITDPDRALVRLALVEVPR